MRRKPKVRGEVLLERHFDLSTLGEVRTDVYTSLVDDGAPDAGALAFTTSVGEGMANAIMHGGGAGELTVCRNGAGGVIAEVRDTGAAEPFPVPRTAPPPHRLGGRGLYLASQLCDRVTVLTGWRGTSLVLELSFA